MSLNSVFMVLFVGISSFLVAQNGPTSPQRMKMVKIEQPSRAEQIASLELNIQQIEGKILFIKNNPVLLREVDNARYLLELNKLKQVSKEKLKLLQK